MAKKVKRDVPMLDVRAAAQPASYDEENRTVEFIASTGARGLRRQLWGDDFHEELEVSEDAIRMERLANGAPFLNSHNNYDISDVLGSVERAWVEDSNLMIRVKFSKRAEVAPILEDIRDGVLRHVSVGYYVHRYDITEQVGELDVYRATDWEPAEVSLVPIGFDDGAVARAGSEVSKATITRSTGPTSKEDVMSKAKKEIPAEEATPVTTEERNETVAPSVDVDAITRDAITAERSRVSDIRKAARMARVSDQVADQLIDEGVSVDAARARIIEQIASDDVSEETTSVRASVDHNTVDNMREAAAEAIIARGGMGKVEAGNPFANMTLLRLCEELLTSQGVQTRGLNPMDLTGRALSTSDLTNIAGAVFNKTLLAGYESSPRTFLNVFRQATANDFRAMNRVRLSGAPALDEVKENGEFKYGKITDEKETYALATYGKILPFTRQTIINDDLDALTRVPQLFGRAAGDLESDLVWDVLIANAALGDGIALFHASHGNLGTAGAVSETTVDEMQQLMMAQTGLEGRLLNVMPSTLIVGPAQKLAAQKLLSDVMADSVGNANVFSNAMNLVVEARLTGNAWYAAADYNAVDTIEFAYLAGNQGVYIETREGFNVDGIEIKARHDFAAKAIDFRGLFKNAGA